MKYEIKSPSSIVVSGENGSSQEYCLPERVSTWQVVELSALLADFTEKASESGSSLINGLLAFVQTGYDFKKMAQALNDYEAVSGFSFAKTIGKGSVDILRYLSKENVIAKVQAILFLKPGERRVEDMASRVAIFEEAPIGLLIGAVRDFFGKKMASLKDTPSGSQIYEMLMKWLSRKKPMTASATNTENSMSGGTSDLSIPLPEEISPESVESSTAFSSEVPNS